ncbi:MAG: extracellular solute-binding protein [Clostridia bacterium]|nr:extracellular solute-binding protein [Clostridia bacterium]
MKKSIKTIAALLALCSVGSFASCMQDGDAVKLTVWVSEADQAFAKQVAEDFKKQNPDKKYNFVFDVQGENEMATRVLGDVESAADIFSFPNDQLTQLVNGDALARVGGERLTAIKAANSADAVDAATVTRGQNEETYGIPYTDNTFFLYYDKSVLSETDVQSLDGILAKCSANKKFAMLVSDGWYNTAFYFGKGLGYNVTYDDNLGETSITCDFNNATGKAVTESLWAYVQDTRVKADADDSKIVAGMDDGSVIAAFSGIWNRNAIERALGENFAAAKLPTYTYGKGTANEEQVQLVSFAGYKLLGVNNYSANKADAFAFADFYTNKENQIKHFEMRSYLPTNGEAQQDERVKTDVCAKAIAAQLAHSKTQKNVPSTLWDPLKGLGNAMITGAQTGNFALLEQLNACVAAIEKNAQ